MKYCIPLVHSNQIKDTFLHEVFLFSISSDRKTKTFNPFENYIYWHPDCIKVALFSIENRPDFDTYKPH